MFLLNPKEEEILKEIRDASYEALRGKDKNGIPFLRHIFELHYKIFGETCSSCPGKITGYIQKLKNYNTKIKMENTKSEFKLNEGVIIPVAGTSDAYSNHNLTDEIAVQLLAQNANRKALFSKIPENVDTLIEEYIASIEVEGGDEVLIIGDKRFTIEETLSLLEKINVKSNATTVAGVLKKIAKLTEEQKTELEQLANDFLAIN
jgi:hypothetical protein